MAVIRTESKFNKDAVSHKNAKGLMQLKEDRDFVMSFSITEE